MTASGLHASAPSVSTEPNRLLDAEALGPLLSVPASWLLREARAGRIPHVRFGKYVRFDPATVEAWWRERMEGPVVVRTGVQPVSTNGNGQQ
jgi:excisionase family DNA binding protein